MECPMCGLSEKFQQQDTTHEHKTKCTGCGAIFHDKDSYK